MLTVENESVTANTGNTELLSSLQKMFDKKDITTGIQDRQVLRIMMVTL